MSAPEPAAAPTAQQVQQNHDALAAIRAEVAASQALVGPLQPTESLLALYGDNPGFLARVPAIVAAYSGIRTVRGDGICFYRALLVALGLSVHAAGGGAPPALLQRVQGAKALLVKHGFDELCSDFIDALVAYLEGLAAPGSSAEAAAVQPLVAAESEASILYGLRLLTTVELHESASEYDAFIMGAFDCTISEFCQRTVLPSYEEADQIQIQALVKWLGVRLTIVSLDAHALHTDVVEGGASPWCSLHVLLRPGHYDVLTARA